MNRGKYGNQYGRTGAPSRSPDCKVERAPGKDANWTWSFVSEKKSCLHNHLPKQRSATSGVYSTKTKSRTL